jgi:hypothetical protein
VYAAHLHLQGPAAHVVLLLLKLNLQLGLHRYEDEDEIFGVSNKKLVCLSLCFFLGLLCYEFVAFSNIK